MINYNKYGITFKPFINKLEAKYEGNEADFKADLAENPYAVLMGVAGMAFKSTDDLVVLKRFVPADSYVRCQYAAYEALKKNEANGHTRIADSDLAKLVYELAPEATPNIVKVVNEDKAIYYNAESNWVSFRATYNAEKNIAYHIKYRLDNPPKAKLDVDIEQFRHIGDGVELTDEQMSMLKLVAESSVCMLNGAAGCVDCDTEFFTGYGWKRIADYEVGDKVLQYNDDGTAELVEPLAYIKRPADYLWHFETKYGVNQTLCDEHNIVYWSPKKARHECKITDIVNAQLRKNGGWDGQFKTTFTYSGNGIDLTDEQIRVMCAVICDGSFYSHANERNNSYYRCRFHIKKERKHERLRLLFSQAGIKWRETESVADGYIDFYINAPMRTKQFDAYWYNCSLHQLQVICDEIMFWDGSTNTTEAGVERNRFSTTTKETADFLQFAFSACGKRATILTNDRSGQKYFTCGKWYTRKSIEYGVATTNRTYAGICHDSRPNHIRTMPKQVPTTDGYKYCFTVPSHMLVLRRKNCIFITGNCGKTSVTKAILDMLDKCGKSYACLAPTGIAAKMMRQYTGRKSSTIHMFLTGPTQPDYVLIDEFSMVGVSLLSLLLHTVGTKPRLIFIGDGAQLASVSSGSLIRDISLYNAVPRVELTKIFRYNTSGIVTIATDSRMGTPDNLTESYPDYQFIPTNDDPIEQVVSTYADLLKAGYNMDDILILCPFNVYIGCNEINRRISEKYNDGEPVRANSNIKLGDRVINIKNTYGMTVADFVANGDIGWLREKKYFKADRANHYLVEFENGPHWIESLANLKQAYAVSVHKSQGGSSKVVIALIDRSHHFMLSRNLLYTAFTRARERLVLIGDIGAIQAGLNVSVPDSRNTWLGEMLNG